MNWKEEKEKYMKASGFIRRAEEHRAKMEACLEQAQAVVPQEFKKIIFDNAIVPARQFKRILNELA